MYTILFILHVCNVGFINPTLYSAGINKTFANGVNIFNDITSGDNKCCSGQVAATVTCCTSGFTAEVGWDAVTGWGSIDYTHLVAVFNNSIAESNNNVNSNGNGNTLGTSSVIIIVVVIVVCLCAGMMLFVYTYGVYVQNIFINYI